jgi:hypothetical protein
MRQRHSVTASKPSADNLEFAQDLRRYSYVRNPAKFDKHRDLMPGSMWTDGSWKTLQNFVIRAWTAKPVVFPDSLANDMLELLYDHGCRECPASLAIHFLCANRWRVRCCEECKARFVARSNAQLTCSVAGCSKKRHGRQREESRQRISTVVQVVVPMPCTSGRMVYVSVPVCTLDRSAKNWDCPSYVSPDGILTPISKPPALSTSGKKRMIVPIARPIPLSSVKQWSVWGISLAYVFGGIGIGTHPGPDGTPQLCIVQK